MFSGKQLRFVHYPIVKDHLAKCMPAEIWKSVFFNYCQSFPAKRLDTVLTRKKHYLVDFFSSADQCENKIKRKKKLISDLAK